MRTYLHALVTYSGRATTAQFDALPRLCPCCGEVDSPWRLAARSTVSDDSAVDFAFQCSQPDCRRVFVATYHRGLRDEYVLEQDSADVWRDQLLTFR